MLVQGSFKNKLNWVSNGGGPSIVAVFKGPSYSAANNKNIGWSALRICCKLKKWKLGSVSPINALNNLFVHPVWASHDIKPTRSNARPRPCKAYMSFILVPTSTAGRASDVTDFKDPCSSVRDCFCPDLASDWISALRDEKREGAM